MMNDLARALNPTVSALTDTVSGVARIPLGIGEQLAAPVMQIPQQYPNLTKLVGGLARMGAGLGGDPLAGSKIDYYKALQNQATSLGNQAQANADKEARNAQAFQIIQQKIPNFDPQNPAHYNAAIQILGQYAGLDAVQDFKSSFDPIQRAESLNKLRDDFVKETAEFAVVEDAYKTITESLNKEIGPTIMLTQFAKLIDPGSVVRGEEVRVLKESGGPYGALFQLIEDYKQAGGPLREKLEQSLRQEAANIYNNKAQRAQLITRGIKRFATEDYGYAPDDFDTKFASGYTSTMLPIATGVAGDLNRFERVSESELPSEYRYSQEQLRGLNSPLYLKERSTGKFVLSDRVFNDPRFPERIRFRYIDK